MDARVMRNGRSAFLFLTWLAVVSHRRVTAMQCYQCNVESNDLCTEDHLTACPTDQAYDRCMTRVTYSKTDGLMIQKRCALAPCNLRDRTQQTGLGLDHCDRSKAEYDCVVCCPDDGCNKDGAIDHHRSAAIASVAFCFTIAFFYSRISTE